MDPTLPAAVAWDMDGVLVDSGTAHKAAWQALGRELDRPFTDDDFMRTFGLANPDIFRIAWGVTDPAADGHGIPARPSPHRRDAPGCSSPFG